MAVDCLVDVPSDGESEASVEPLMRAAVSSGYSKRGEMFDSSQLCALAQSVLADEPVSFEVCDLAALPDNAARVAQVSSALYDGGLVLLAYDADKDNTPCRRSGARAHWCVVKGVLQPFVGVLRNDDTHQFVDDPDNDEQRRCDNSAVVADTLFTVAHSKSKRPAIWKAYALLDSSAQLTTPDVERNDSDEFVMPDSLTEILALKAIVIKPRR